MYVCITHNKCRYRSGTLYWEAIIWIMFIFGRFSICNIFSNLWKAPAWNSPLFKMKKKDVFYIKDLIPNIWLYDPQMFIMWLHLVCLYIILCTLSTILLIVHILWYHITNSSYLTVSPSFSNRNSMSTKR